MWRIVDLARRFQPRGSGILGCIGASGAFRWCRNAWWPNLRRCSELRQCRRGQESLDQYTSDGKRILSLVPAGEPVPNSITVVLNWAEELEKN